MAEGRTYSLHPQLDIRQILLEAKTRWLRPSEICEILRNYKQFQLTTDPPYKPCGGSLYLFDRKALRYFRKDGHHWRKKKDGKTVREAHEKLKSGSVDVLHCYYAHGEDNENFQRRSYWLLDGNLEHIVLVHYRDVDEGSRSSISHLLNADSRMLDHIQGSQNSSAAFSAQRNSCNFASQASYASSSGTADLSGQTRSSEYEDPDSGDDFVGSSLVGSMSCSGLNIASMSGNDREENNVASSSSHPYAGVPTNLRGLNGPCSSFYGSQVDAQYVTESVQQNVIYGASQIADIFGGACSSSYTAPSIWPEILCSNREFSNLQDKTFSFERSDDAGAVAKNMTYSLLDSSGLVTYVAEGGYQFFLDAHVQMSVGDGSTQAQVKEENAEGVNCPVNKHLEGGAPHSCQSLNEQFFHMTPSLKNDSKSQATVTATDQPIESEAVASSALKDPLRGDMHNDEHVGFRKLDSFGRWMDKEIGRDCDDSLMSSDSASYWNVLQTQSDDKEVSNITKHMQLDTDSLGPSLSQEQLFSILDFSPDWAFSGVETKILITGTFLGGIDPSSIKWGCMFGEDEVSAELLMSNVLRCQVPLRALGRVPFYVTCSDRLACSQIREFEYRENSFFGSSSLESEPENEICFQVHLAKMLLRGVDRKGPFCSTESCHKCNLIDDLFLSLRDAEDGWDTLVQDSNAFQGCPRDPRDALIEKLLKGWLLEWLANKVHEEGKGPNVLNADGLGIIHITAALGYEWAISPIITAGVNPNFRDARGRTALHWAAYFGREETVVMLVGLGASPGAVEDPTSKFPGGRTAADLASSRGHKGIAGYLAEEDLTSHLSTLALKENVMDSVSANLAAEKAVESIKDQDVAFLGRNNKEQLTLRGSLAAVRNSAQAAARIQAAFRVHSFCQRKIMESNDGNVESTNVAILLPSVNNKIQKMSHFNDSLHAAAIKIQQKYRGFVGRKEFLKIRNRIVRIQAHVRGHQVRKQYKKVVWSVSIVEKAILRWRRKGAGLRGFRADKPIEPVGLEFQNTDEYDFLRHGRKQKVAGVEKALARVQSMVRYPEARDQYMRLVASSHKSKLGDGGKQYAQGPDQERKIDEDLSAPMIH